MALLHPIFPSILMALILDKYGFNTKESNLNAIINLTFNKKTSMEMAWRSEMMGERDGGATQKRPMFDVMGPHVAYHIA